MPQPAPSVATLADYWIGDFDFISMDGFPEVAKQQPVTEVRPGTHGHGLWLTGIRGQPTQVVTWRDTLNLDDAAQAYANYTSVIGSTVSVLYAGRPFNTQFDILQVETVGQDSVISTVLGVGGRLGISTGLIICRWTLMAFYPHNL